MRQWTVGLIAIFAANVTGADDYVFRNGERPVYDDVITVDQLRREEQSSKIVLIDVRLSEDYEADPVLIPGAIYRNPEDIEVWSEELPADSKIVVYCVKGKWVSQKAASYLNDRGMDVRSLAGGIEAWKQAQD